MQKFFLKIDAESPDGEAVQCETHVKVACVSQMAITVLANVMKQDVNLKKLVAEALILAIEDGVTSEKITDEEYKKRVEEDQGDLNF